MHRHDEAANRQYLAAHLERIRRQLTAHATRMEDAAGIDSPEEAPLPEPAPADRRPFSLDRLQAIFRLSDFERDTLLLCAGMELDGRFPHACSQAQVDDRQAYPTFALALAALPEASWKAIASSAPLRRWRLIEVGEGTTLVSSPLRIDERILQCLLGFDRMDARLAALLEPSLAEEPLTPAMEELAERIAAIWSQPSDGSAPQPVIQLCGPDSSSGRAVAERACELLEADLRTIAAPSLGSGIAEWTQFITLWEREALLSERVLLLDAGESDPAPPVLAHLLRHLRSPLIVSTRERHHLDGRPVLTMEVERPTPEVQRQIWREAAGEAFGDLEEALEQITGQFRLGAGAIQSIWMETLRDLEVLEGECDPGRLGLLLWDNCRRQARSRLESLAQRVESKATWDDLILPPSQMDTLREIAANVGGRTRVYEKWGFGVRSSRGLGVSALFSGTSGTGKTMAAEVLANHLRLDLYRVDVSAVVNKYIGETEKNLRRLFDAAEESGAILLFDEADALFGKRSEVKDSHDRHANIEVSYLLQRMEAYSGLAILTTNLPKSFDPAFMRRLRFIVTFPFPDVAERTRIWKRAFPRETPVEGLDFDKLARLSLSGGDIRNVALSAAFLAVADDSPVTMSQVMRAARSEFAKQEKRFVEIERRAAF